MAPRTSYGSITVKQENDDEELARLVSQGQDNRTGPSSDKKRYFAVGVAALLAAVGLTSFLGGGSHDKTSVSSSSSHFKHFPMKDETKVLSSKSPMDMGFLSIEREQDASPSVIWGNRTGPLPTNSWYLVRLSVGFVVPNLLFRVLLFFMFT